MSFYSFYIFLFIALSRIKMFVCFAVIFFAICFILSNAKLSNFPFANEINKKYDCLPNTSDSMMSVAYLSADPYYFGQILNITVNNLNISYEPKNFMYSSRTLMMYSCICSELEENTFDFFTLPLMINVNRNTDALVLCALHSADQDISSILNIPLNNLEFFMMSQFSILMPRNLIADNNTVSEFICKDKYGNNVKSVPGQTVCFYLNHVKHDIKLNTISYNLSYYGPPLSSQFPTLPVMLLKDSIPFDKYIAQLWLICSTLQKSRITMLNNFNTTCEYGIASNEEYSTYTYLCCCYEDMNDCDEMAANDLTSMILCVNHKTENIRITVYAAQCWIRVIYEYVGDLSLNFDNPLPVVTPNSTTIDDLNSTSEYFCENSTTLNVKTIRYCSNSNFCNVFDGHYVEKWKKCKYSRDIELHTKYGCVLIVYKNLETWAFTSPIWFNWTESMLIPLEQRIDDNSTYNVYKAYLPTSMYFKKCFDDSNLEFEFFAISCDSNLCDSSLFNIFLNNANNTNLYELTLQANVPHCNSGFMIYPFDTTGNLTIPTIVNVTRVVGKYCKVLLFLQENFFIRITYESEHDKPNQCDGKIIKTSKREYFCCYKSFDRTDESVICNNATIITEARRSKNKNNADHDKYNFSGLNRTNVFEEFDDCEQRQISRRSRKRNKCVPGGFGCFHLLGTDADKKDTIASCTGFAEERIANDNQFYHDSGVALLCLVPESKDKCQYVYNNGLISLLCCCQTQTKFKHVKRCVEDSKLMFHVINRPPLRIKAFGT